MQAKRGRPVSLMRQMLDEMAVGDSIFVEGNRDTLQTYCHNWRKRTGKVVTTKHVTFRGQTGLRIWRTK